MSSGYGRAIRAGSSGAHRRLAGDPAETVAFVAVAKRSLLLHLNRHRLRREDLEDCYSQAVLELIMHVRAGGSYADEKHVANALELRFNSRIRDRRRAIGGRSPMQAALEVALTLAEGDDGLSVVDRRADIEREVILREEVREVGGAVRELSKDQQTVLAAQLGPSAPSTADFCRAHGWSAEKYRKVSQRARARLAKLTGRQHPRVPPARQTSVEVSGTTYDTRSVDP